MYVIIFRNRKQDNPGEQWRLLPNGLYFDKIKALKNAEIFTMANIRFIYDVRKLVYLA